MHLSARILAGLLVGAVSGLVPAAAGAAEFTARIVSRLDNRETRGQIAVKGDRLRREFPSANGATIVIGRRDRRVIWMVMPAQKRYLEMPFTQETYEKMAQVSKDVAKMKLLGTETVNGYATEKYETSLKTNGSAHQSLMWVSKQLGMPIKIVSLDGSFSQEYQDIKEGGVPDSLFEEPQGYQKVTVPAGAPGGQ